MSIEKAMYAAPQGLPDLEGPDVEIEIVDPEDVIVNGIDLMPEETEDEDFNANLAEYLPESICCKLLAICWAIFNLT